MLNLNKLKQLDPKMIVLGSYPSIIQSILDFDYLSGREVPSIIAVISTAKKRFFWGTREIFLPTYTSIPHLLSSSPSSTLHSPSSSPNLFLNVNSARRVLSSTKEALDAFPSLVGGAIFAEDTPEQHALELKAIVEKRDGFIIGPSSIGIFIPGFLKLGAIGGVSIEQVEQLTQQKKPGDSAIFCASGGMTNELINIARKSGGRISFSFSFGGDRFPITTPREAFIQAQNDPKTKRIIYYGELGGYDEYELVEEIKHGHITKPVFAYIAGSIAELFEIPPQFGHAKAMAKAVDESAAAKRKALASVGVHVFETLGAFEKALSAELTKNPVQSISLKQNNSVQLRDRKHAMFTSTLNDFPLQELGEKNTLGYVIASFFLGRPIKSKELADLTETAFKLLIDHGPHVSGAVNTMITARAGKDMPAAVASGMLTIGDRFGGAVNEAAKNWFEAVQKNEDAHTFVEKFASKKQYIAGIGHKKYRIDLPDPRVKKLLSNLSYLGDLRYTNFARSVEKITTTKKGNLILNVDGALAAVLLDVLTEKEQLTNVAIQQLIDCEFFNAFFVAARTIGFIGHFLDQKRLNEGLFRLPDEEVVNI